MSPRATKLINRTCLNLLMLIASVLFLTPMAIMASTSIKPADQAIDSDQPGLLPVVPDNPVLRAEHMGIDLEALAAEISAKSGETVTREQAAATIDPSRLEFTARSAAKVYSDAWSNEIVNFPQALQNSLIICVLSVTGMVTSSAIVAFGMSRIEWPGRGIAFACVLATMMVPYPVLMSTLYVLFNWFGWIGSFKPLWVPTFFGGAFQIFLLRQFFLSIPKDLDEAATIDGCGRFGIFWRIILPLSRPALAVVALFQFIFAWNDFLGPLVYLTQQDQFTLALGLQQYQSQYGNTPWNQLMAASAMISAPVLVLFFLTQRTFVEGIATQGLKG